MERQKTILVVDDEPHIVLGLRDALEFEGFRVVTAQTGAEAVQVHQRERPDAVLLDLMLPDQNGYQVCQQIRRSDALVPVIMLTAKSQEADKIRGLDSGADDYVTKPFSVGELSARVRALLRRAQRPAEQELQTVRIGEVTVNLATHTLSGPGGQEVLSFYELELIRLLYERKGQPVSREEILRRIWGLEQNPANRTIDNFVVKLRKKVERTPNQPVHILTVYGMGYKLVP
ncbi:MAG TPA: response regulator transcription factor [Polyangiaceae bacterium]|nr:response regulator transcription factor [Polyangiaceae bacterium]